MAVEFKKIRGIPHLYQHPNTEIYYERIQEGGKNTWQSLETTRKDSAKDELERRRVQRRNERNGAVPSKMATAGKTPCRAIINRFVLDGLPDKKGNARLVKFPDDLDQISDENDRGERVLKACEEEDIQQALFIRNLRQFFNERLFETVTQDTLDTYKKERTKVTKKEGLRMVDREIDTLAAAFSWGVRKELIPFNSIAERVKFYSAKDATHCRDRMPDTIDEAHEIARLMFELRTKEAESCAWQYLVEIYTALRTQEALQLRNDARQDEPGAVTPDGKSFRVHHVKETHYQNQYVRVNEGLAAVLEEHARWKAIRFPDSPWFFPGHVTGQALHKKSLAHVLEKLFKRQKLRKWFSSHGARAFYVFIRRSQGAHDEVICFEINHMGGLETLRRVYGVAPKHWLTGEAPNYPWKPVKWAWEGIPWEKRKTEEAQEHKERQLKSIAARAAKTEADAREKADVKVKAKANLKKAA